MAQAAAGHFDGAAIRRLRAEHGLERLRTAGAEQARQGDDLLAANLQ